MNIRRRRPRVNYPIMKKGGRHVVSRKRPRRDGQKELNTQLQEVTYEKEEERRNGSS